MPDPHPFAQPREAVIAVDSHHPLGRIDDDIYGHFLESAFFGNIEGGVLDEGSALAVDEPGLLQGVRSDVLDLVRDLEPGVIRWPGGNFTSAYHWEDAVGPRDERPTRLELAWGELETNRFGTDEFLAWCEQVGAPAYLAHSARDVDEAVRWVEYTNAHQDTALTRRRAANGRSEPWNVRYWGVGNEVYGPWQMGHRTAEQYAADALEHARFMRAVDPDIRLIGVGIPWNQEAWTRPLLTRAGRYLDYVSLHLYGASNHLWAGDDYDAMVAQSLYFEQEISTYSQLVTDLALEAGLDRPPALALDEWTMRHLEPTSWPAPQAGADGGVAPRETTPVADWPGGVRVNRWSPRTIGDAVFCAGVFHAIHRTAGSAAPVAMANPVNLVNANGLVVARPGGAFRSAIYHVWNLYRHHTGRTVLPCAVDGPARSANVRQGDQRSGRGEQTAVPMTVPFVDACATRADDGTVRLAVINRHRDEAIRVRPVIDGSADGPRQAHLRCLGGDLDGVNTVNDLTQPDAVTVRDHGQVDADGGGWLLPPHSITVLTLERA
ncbi:alpha-L-arabinofuranosidase C-terminal domain-containing protein [Ruania halotolerans]|uniref:alpha-L-arabinofuranosidase C-terminal domain-containing protein n=1 Tax=Ruania halotolerans TaxID=2897773 RepID=UPI001E336DB0|nr:alpha-L-arabinofuranosidase C-terminal domain-containing protein [Ruania halotolerans]UFU06486.1 alpha-N-arabinofuranosidase [Ruania halotolerans]